MGTDVKPTMNPIEAAGGLLWRRKSDGLEIALVHRSRYDDWALPKGKLNHGEPWVEGALREVKEETGYDARVLGFAGAVAYETSKGPKVVRFWNMTTAGEDRSEVDSSEVAEVVWLSPRRAMEQLSYRLEKVMVAAWETEMSQELPSYSTRDSGDEPECGRVWN